MSQENKIYVGNLEYSVTDEELKGFFEEKGIQTIEVKIVQDKYTGKSKGFGFVSVDSEDTLNKAIEATNGQDFKGRPLRVNKARPPRERGMRDRRY